MQTNINASYTATVAQADHSERSEMTTQYFSRPEGTLAYEDAGQGPLVLALPSMGDSRAEYRFLTPLLVKAGYRVVTLDLRGLGESSTGWTSHTPEAIGDDIIALLRHLDAGPAVVIGESFTAGSAVWAAANTPDLIGKLVLIGPFVRETTAPWLMKLVMNVVLKIGLRGPWSAATWKAYYASLYPTAKPADFTGYLERLTTMLREPGRMAALRAMAEAPKTAIAGRFAEVQSPVLVIMGSKDPDFPAGAETEASWIAGQLGGRHVMIDGAGHYPHAEMPDITAATIIPFLNDGK